MIVSGPEDSLFAGNHRDKKALSATAICRVSKAGLRGENKNKLCIK